ncbi:MAG: acyl-CoA/acyl-ACP dehydrogenase, partial [Desulfobacteraceae bacterium]
MNYDLSEEQRILKDTARDFLLKESPSKFVREMAKDEKGYTQEIWQKMVRLGWPGILIPEECGGHGMSFLDLSLLLYEMGYACLPGPFFSTAILGVITLMEAGNHAMNKGLLNEVARGERLLTFAWTENSGSNSDKTITAKSDLKNKEYVLSGTKLFVPNAHVADTILCAARTEDPGMEVDGKISLFMVDKKSSGLDIHHLRTIADDKQYGVTFDKVRVPKDHLLGKLGQGWSVLKRVLQKAAV